MNSGDIGITIVFVTLMILALIAVLIVVLFTANRRHINQEMKIAQLQVSYQRELRSTEQEVTEQVLANIGRELHDNIGQMLTFMNMQLETQTYVAPAMQQSLKGVSETLNSTIAEVRRLSKSLNGDLLEINGLRTSIDNELVRLRQLDKFIIHESLGPEPILDKDQKLIAFRIFQEVLNNMMKHAHARNVSVMLAGSPGFQLRVSDDGVGFNVAEMMASPKGAGLKNMVKRAELAKMKCVIDAGPGKGATFTLTLI